jgi:hypothetical protein
MLKAWSEDSFEYNSQIVNVTPKPHSRPRPFFFIGGMSAAAARRAARFGLPFAPPMAIPDVEALYREECTKNGHRSLVYRPENGSTVTLLSHDPEAAWTAYGCYVMNEAAEYSAWKRPGVRRPNEMVAESIDHLRRLRHVEILTPGDLIAQIRCGRREVVMNPLIGGLPLEAGWASLRLLGDEVLPSLESDPGNQKERETSTLSGSAR